MKQAKQVEMSTDEEMPPKQTSEDPKKYRTVEERALNHYQAMVILNPKDYRQYVKLGDALCLKEKF